MPNGGKREGAGAKPLPPELRKQPYCCKLAPDILSYLRSLSNGSAEIDRVMRRSQGFRAWVRREKSESE